MAHKKRRGPRSSLGAIDAKPPPWFERTSALLALLDPRGAEPSSSRNVFIPPSSMTLRARKPAAGQGTTTTTSPAPSPDGKKAAYQSRHVGEAAATADASPSSSSSSSSSSSPSPEPIPETTPPHAVAKKLPRVILKVGPRPET